MSERWVPHASHLPDCGFHDNFWTLIIFGRVLWLSLNQPRHRRRRENIIYYTVRNFLLHQDGLRAEEWGVMYQKCVHIVLKNQIGRNVKSYIDDIVVKSKDMRIYLMTSERPSIISVSTRWCLILTNTYLTYHQGSCSAIWCRTGDRCKSH
jgi:hypothetical protein